jgi:parallel beta-helix repeat protein
MGYCNNQAIMSDTSYNVSIINNTLHNSTYGIVLEYSNGNTISDNTITDNRYRGIRVQFRSSDAIIENNTILRNGNRGISVYYYSNNNTIIGNMINENGGGDDGCGVWVSYSCDGTNIIDNTIQYNTNKGIDIRDGSINTNITGNDVSYNDGLGFGNSNTIHIDGNIAAPCDSVIIKDNIVRDNPNIGNAAIYIWECSNNQIVNNTVTGHDGPQGVVSLCVSDNNIISDNNVSFNTDLIYGGVTLYSCDNNTVTRNVLINNTDYNIHILWNGTNTIYDNYIGGDVSTAIYHAGVFNLWNVTSRPGPNIIGGPSIGGNYYTDYTDNDTNGDGFGESPYLIENKASVPDGYDWLPLTEVAGEPDPALCGDVDCDDDVDIYDVIGVYRRACNSGYELECANEADTDCDNDVDIYDVIGVYRKACNSSYVLNCC